MLPYRHYRSYDRKDFTVSIFACPMSKRANCRSELRLSVGNEVVILEVNAPQDLNSHKEQTQHRLSLEAQHKIRECVAVDASMTASAIGRVISRNSEQVDVRNHQRVKRMVKNARSDVMLEASPLGKVFLTRTTMEKFVGALRIMLFAYYWIDTTLQMMTSTSECMT